MTSPALRCLTAWTEDRATQRCDPSAAPGAETGAGAKPCFAPLHPSLRDRHESDKPSRQDAANCPAGCAPRFANAQPPKFQFTLNQYTSCHHAALVIWSMREAKQRGHAVDEPVLAELTKWIAESGNGKFGLERPTSAPNAASPKAVWFALALGLDYDPDEVALAGRKLLLTTVKSEQTENGSWSTWPETRPPIFGSSDESLTALAILALLPDAAAGDDSAKAASEKGIKWLTNTKSDDDPQSIALRLILWRRLGRPAEEWRQLVQRIRERQNDDGGWSQTKDMPSDAWATGQALYALAQTDIKNDDPVISRAQIFLIQAQRDDGSWPMTSRPVKAGGEGSQSLIPITGAGSAWAVLGLVRSRSN